MKNKSFDILLSSITSFQSADVAAVQIWNKINNYEDRENPECQELIKQYHELRKLRNELFTKELDKDCSLNIVFSN